jgi:hypothetical protein
MLSLHRWNFEDTIYFDDSWSHLFIFVISGSIPPKNSRHHGSSWTFATNLDVKACNLLA